MLRHEGLLQIHVCTQLKANVEINPEKKSDQVC